MLELFRQPQIFDLGSKKICNLVANQYLQISTRFCGWLLTTSWPIRPFYMPDQAYMFCDSLHWQAVSSVDSRLVLLVTKCKPRLFCNSRFLTTVEQSNVNPWCKCKTMSLYHVLCFYVVKWSYFSDTTQISLTWATFVIIFFQWELCVLCSRGRNSVV